MIKYLSNQPSQGEGLQVEDTKDLANEIIPPKHPNVGKNMDIKVQEALGTAKINYPTPE